MAKADNRERILAVERIIVTSQKPLTVKKISEILSTRYDIEADRKTIYSDISAITRFINIQYIHKCGYYVVRNDDEADI